MSVMTSMNPFISPSSFCSDSPRYSIAAAISSVGFARLVRVVLSAVPPWEALMPALAISPSAMAVSSALYPREPATGATYLKDSPSMVTFVFALEDAAARTSAKCPDCSAFIPNAVNASVTMSDVIARSSPAAAARFMMPSMPSSMSVVFHPAMAM